MNLRELEYLIAIDETRHFHRAAERSHVSQPTLSGQLKKLEEELGVLLVDRTSRHVAMTEVGSLIAEKARKVFAEVKSIKESLVLPEQTCRLSVAPVHRIPLLPMKKPRDLLEYVVVHEMVHLLESTHSEHFIALLNKHYPTWRDARAELNELPLTAEEWKE